MIFLDYAAKVMVGCAKVGQGDEGNKAASDCSG